MFFVTEVFIHLSDDTGYLEIFRSCSSAYFKFPLLMEWAYAGFFFAMSGALLSRIVTSNSVNEIFPSLLLLILTLASWYFRPADGKIISVNE